MKTVFIIALSLLAFTGFGQTTGSETENRVEEPIFFIDSVRADISKVKELNPKEILSVSVYKKTEAVKLVGPEGRSGIVYIETKKDTPILKEKRR